MYMYIVYMYTYSIHSGRKGFLFNFRACTSFMFVFHKPEAELLVFEVVFNYAS